MATFKGRIIRAETNLTCDFCQKRISVGSWLWTIDNLQKGPLHDYCLVESSPFKAEGYLSYELVMTPIPPPVDWCGTR